MLEPEYYATRPIRSGHPVYRVAVAGIMAIGPSLPLPITMYAAVAYALARSRLACIGFSRPSILTHLS